MFQYWRELQAGTIRYVPQHHWELYERYVTGDLDQELDALTQRHGFGLLRTQPGHLGPLGVTRETPA